MTEEYSLAVAYGADQRAKTFKPQFTVENVNRGFCFAVCFALWSAPYATADFYFAPLHFLRQDIIHLNTFIYHIES